MKTDLFDIFNNADKANNRAIVSLFEQATRVKDFSITTPELYLDYSKQNIDKNELSELIQWAKNGSLSSKITAMFRGDKINNTENRAVQHCALRAPTEVKTALLGPLCQDVVNAEQVMEKIVEQVTQGKLTSITGKKYTDVLAIGIGGSYYGIKVCSSALKPYQCTGLNLHVLANVDGAAVNEKLNMLSAQTTLVIVISKTFTTQETMLNAQAVKNWMLAEFLKNEAILNNNAVNNIDRQALTEQMMATQWYAVSSNIEKVKAFGLDDNHILPMWDWVGGRFSLWSAVGLPLALAIGNDNFALLKQGAYEMDQHFQTADFESNMPVIMALLGLWNRNGLNYESLAILPYEHALRALPGYLQQTDMESNGKSVSVDGVKLPWATAPIVFGQEGTNGQHAFMQLMHQSDEIIPTDFIVSLQGSSELKEHHQVLVANCFAQSEALMQGKTLSQVKTELTAAGLSDEEVERLAPHKTMKGNTPSNTLVMKTLNPKSLGALLALYEHKIFVQGVLWQLNSFDQWGVELGKLLGNQVLAVMNGGNSEQLSSSSHALIKLFNQSDW